MKKFIAFAIILLSSLQNIAVAQKVINDATLRYDIEVSAEPGSKAANAFQGATWQVQLKGSNSRTDMESGLGKEVTIHDGNSGKAVVLKEYSGQKLMITLTKENWANKNKRFQQIRFTTGTETKKINGFECKKATGTFTTGEVITVYYDPTVVPGNRSYNNAFAGLNGLPVQYELKSGNNTFVYTLKSVNDDIVPSARFDIPKSGYRTMTYDENRQL